jgi:Icc-related predicted phosphoesterase
VKPTRVFFASDIHGSDATFRKFVNAARFYGADTLVFGGDLMGKALVPIVEQAGGGHMAELQGITHRADDPDSLRALQKKVQDTGSYWEVMGPDRYESLAEDEFELVRLFQRLASERLRAWVAFAEERLGDSPIRCYLTGGNDDDPDVLSVLDDAASTDHVVASEHRVVELDAEHTMITIGYSTPTPWNTQREATEEEIAAAIEDSMAAVPDPSRCVFNVHVPPIGSGLDRCVKIDTSTDPPTPVMVGGRPEYTRGGSQAVLDAIRAYQPAVGLHGHIHESPGRIRYGRTKCFNPGSEYGQGILNGVLLSLKRGEITSYQHTVG